MEKILDNIGDQAGQVYRLLEKKGPMTLSALKKQFKNPRDIVPMGIGWLARENKISFTEEGRNLLVHIK